jgi:hypothetical protein
MFRSSSDHHQAIIMIEMITVIEILFYGSMLVQHVRSIEIKTKLKNMRLQNIDLRNITISYICTVKYYNCIKDMLKEYVEKR